MLHWCNYAEYLLRPDMVGPQDIQKFVEHPNSLLFDVQLDRFVQAVLVVENSTDQNDDVFVDQQNHFQMVLAC
jgi:hypothetical protein